MKSWKQGSCTAANEILSQIGLHRPKKTIYHSDKRLLKYEIILVSETGFATLNSEWLNYHLFYTLKLLISPKGGESLSFWYHPKGEKVFHFDIIQSGRKSFIHFSVWKPILSTSFKQIREEYNFWIKSLLNIASLMWEIFSVNHISLQETY